MYLFDLTDEEVAALRCDPADGWHQIESPVSHHPPEAGDSP
jgi:hypothetical protein